MKHLFLALALTILAAGMSSCKKDNPSPTVPNTPGTECRECRAEIGIGTIYGVNWTYGDYALICGTPAEIQKAIDKLTYEKITGENVYKQRVYCKP